MDFLKLRTFYCVAKLGSLTDASKHLKYSIPNLSRQITALEEDLNINLFHRKGNKLFLTDQGNLLFQKAAPILAEIESTKNLVQKEIPYPIGSLRISTTTAIASVWLTPYLKEFLTHYPDMRLHIYGDDKNIEFNPSAYDVRIGPYISSSPNLIQKYLMTSYIGLYASQEYLRTFGTPTSLQDLDHHRLIGRNNSGDLPSHAVNWHLFGGKDRDGPGREPFISSPSHHSIIDLALAGTGIACLSSIIKDVRQDQLIQILSKYNMPSIEFYYIYSRDMKNDTRIVCLQNYLLNHVIQENNQKRITDKAS